VNDPLRYELTVEVPAVEAFDTWTLRISTWWPRKHTRSRDRSTAVVIEPRIGGRIFERTASGEELHWGSVIAWDRPKCFGYRWHITSPPEEATEVEIRFTEVGVGITHVTIEHTGFETLGERGPARRGANQRHWERLIPEYVCACGRVRTA
jgi:Activator of Hsp90 ATPase homolog 1-like protein